MDYQENQGSFTKIWYIVGAVVVIALVVWYFYGRSVPTVSAPASTATTQNPATGTVPTSAVTTGNTTTDIANDLNNTPDATAGLNADAAASAQAVQGL
ncbi:MAG: hypothetical protein Q8L52_03695 [bacterium]|nr:hypothetical protein [bacterium]